MKRLEFWFDFSCPYAYLGSTQVEALAARAGARLELRPMLLGGVFRARSVPQKLFSAISTNKARHNAADLVRYAQRWRVPYAMPAGHPFRTVTALRALLVVGADNLALIHRFFSAYWVEGRDLSERSVVASVLSELGHDAEQVLAAAEREEIKEELRRRTDEAIDLGIFGAPAFIPREGVHPAELYWGQDRLEEVERALTGARPQKARAAPPARPLRLYFDYACPYAALVIDRAIEACGAALSFEPVLNAEILRADYPPEGLLPATSEAKTSYLARDLARRAEEARVTLGEASGDTRLALAATRLALAGGADGALVSALFAARFARAVDLSDPAALRAELERLGLDGARLVEEAGTASAGQALERATHAARERGVFGVPSFTLDGEEDGGLYFGSDRIELALEAAARALPG